MEVLHTPGHSPGHLCLWHTSQETQKYLNSVPDRFEFVFTPTHGSWLNMVEGFFSKMTKQMLGGILVSSKEELAGMKNR